MTTDIKISLEAEDLFEPIPAHHHVSAQKYEISKPARELPRLLPVISTSAIVIAVAIAIFALGVVVGGK